MFDSTMLAVVVINVIWLTTTGVGVGAKSTWVIGPQMPLFCVQ